MENSRKDPRAARVPLDISKRPARVAIYARVSTTDQTTDNQVLDLQRYCVARGWLALPPFTDTGVSGSKEERPALRQVLDLARKRKIDVVLVWRFDRFARSVKHLVDTLEEFRQLGVGFSSFQEGIDTNTAQGKMVFTFLAGIAEFERSIIIERINAGLRRARSQGKTLGRPALSDEIKNDVLSYKGQHSTREIARITGVSLASVKRVLAQNHGRNVASVIDEDHVTFSRDLKE